MKPEAPHDNSCGFPERPLGKGARAFLLALSCVAISTLESPAATSEAASELTRTSPVGFATLRVPGKSARAISVPLNNAPVFAGTMESVSGTTVTVSGASWAPDVWGPFLSNPFVVRLSSGETAGQVFPIISNGSGTLVLEENSLGRISPGQQFEIVPVDTLAGLFGETGQGLLTHADPSKADNVMIHDGLGWNTYYNDGTKWLKTGAGAESQNTVALLPDQGIFIVRRAATALVVSINGEVPPSPAATELPADAAFFLANPFPINTRLSELQLQEDPSWLKGKDADSADRVLIYSGKDWTVYYHDGKQWRQKGGTKKDPLVTKGSAVVIERKAGSDILLAPEPPYSLN